MAVTSTASTGNASSSGTQSMSPHTLNTVRLLTELLLTLRENNAHGFKQLPSQGLEDLGLGGVDELQQDLLMPLHSEMEADRIVFDTGV